jgi:hypothetical protein
MQRPVSARLQDWANLSQRQEFPSPGVFQQPLFAFEPFSGSALDFGTKRQKVHETFVPEALHNPSLGSRPRTGADTRFAHRGRDKECIAEGWNRFRRPNCPAPQGGIAYPFPCLWLAPRAMFALCLRHKEATDLCETPAPPGVGSRPCRRAVPGTPAPRGRTWPAAMRRDLASGSNIRRPLPSPSASLISLVVLFPRTKNAPVRRAGRGAGNQGDSGTGYFAIILIRSTHLLL